MFTYDQISEILSHFSTAGAFVKVVVGVSVPSE